MLEDVFQAFNYLAAGSSCPLIYTLKEVDCLTDICTPYISYSSTNNTISSVSNIDDGFYKRFCIVANNSIETASIKDIEITQLT